MYRKRGVGWKKHMDFMILELICFQLAFSLAYMIRHGFVNPYGLLLYRNTALVGMLIQVFIIISFDVYKDILWRGYYTEFVSTVKTVVYVMFMVVFYMFLIQQGSIFSRVVLLGTAGYYFILTYVMRCIRKIYLRNRENLSSMKKSLMIITTKASAKDVLNNIQKKNIGEFTIKGIIYIDCEDEQQEEIDGIPVIAGADNATEYICRNWVDELFMVVPYMEDKYRRFLDDITDMNVVVHICVGYEEDFPMRKRTVQQFGDYMVVTVSASVLSDREAFAKRAMDIICGLIGCIFTAIITIVIGPLIYIKSPGPIFFSQERIGLNGKKFRMYKFRSMYPDAESRKKELEELNEMKDGFMFKIDNDPRIIGSEKGPGKGIGNFIRKTSIDEFPQFFNVLKGDMSLVGTRPPTPDEWERYEPYHRGRMSVRPGITGMWQISGRSDILEFDKVVELDRKYIAEWTVGLDIKIILKTIDIVVRGVGAR